MERVNLDVVLGGPLHPDEHLTRGEFAYFLGRIFDLVQGEGTFQEAEAAADGRPYPFLDVPPEAPYAPRLADLHRLGLLTGTGPGRFSPERLLTRLELMAVAGRVVRLGVESDGAGQPLTPGPIQVLDLAPNGGSVLAVYKDEVLVPDWARADVELAVAAGVIRGRPGGVLVPHVPATRAEALAVFARLLQRLPVKER
jgi:hypothetical protein